MSASLGGRWCAVGVWLRRSLFAAAAASVLAVGADGTQAASGALDPVSGSGWHARNSAAAVRPGFQIGMHSRDWASAGDLRIEKLANSNGYTSLARLSSPWRSETAFVLLRPGRCFAEPPPPNRSVHPWGGSEGELPISYETLRQSSFAAEIVSQDGSTLACGRHSGATPLAANARGVKATGRARWRGGTLSFSGGGVSVTLTPSSGGLRTKVAASENSWGGSSGDLAHLRPGSCVKVAPGREWPIELTPYDVDSPSTGSVVLAIPFSRIRTEPFAFEVHFEPIGVEVVRCVDLYTGA